MPHTFVWERATKPDKDGRNLDRRLTFHRALEREMNKGNCSRAERAQEISNHAKAYPVDDDFLNAPSGTPVPTSIRLPYGN